MLWLFYAILLFCLLYVVSQLSSSPSRVLDHVTYLSGTLGTGKTSFASLIAAECRKNGTDYYSTFCLNGAIPLDLDTDPWPSESGIFIILDELLLLEANSFIDWGKFSDGLALARQKGQRVLILSQAHRPGWGKLTGTIGVFCIIRGWSLGRLGRIVQIRRSSEPFTRLYGFKAPNQHRSWHWIPSRVFDDYDSKLIFGYTCNSELTKFSDDDMQQRRIERDARRLYKKNQAREEARRLGRALSRPSDALPARRSKGKSAEKQSP